MKRKRKLSLPRVTLLAFNRRDLLAFAEAVESLRLLVADLAAEVKKLSAVAAVAAKRRSAGHKVPKDSVCREDLPPAEGGAP